MGSELAHVSVRCLALPLFFSSRASTLLPGAWSERGSHAMAFATQQQRRPPLSSAGRPARRLLPRRCRARAPPAAAIFSAAGPAVQVGVRAVAALLGLGTAKAYTDYAEKVCGAARRGAGGLCFERGSSTGATWQRGEERPRRGASARGRDARHIARMGPYDGGSARWCACGRPRRAPGTPSPWPWVQSAGVSWRAAAPPVAGSRARVVVSGADSESGCTLNAAGQPREPRDPETGAPERCQQQGREEEEC